MEASFKMLRAVRMAMLVAVVLYVFVGERTPHGSTPANIVFYYAIAALAAAMGGGILVVRRVMVQRAEQPLAGSEQDAASLVRWRTGHIVIYAFSEAIALYGLVLRFMGFSLSQAVPFYAAGFVLLFFFNPRRPSNTIG